MHILASAYRLFLPQLQLASCVHAFPSSGSFGSPTYRLSLVPPTNQLTHGTNGCEGEGEKTFSTQSYKAVGGKSFLLPHATHQQSCQDTAVRQRLFTADVPK